MIGIRINIFLNKQISRTQSKPLSPKSRNKRKKKELKKLKRPRLPSMRRIISNKTTKTSP